MPKIIWSEPAVADLSNIRRWLVEETGQEFALEMLKRIRASVARLSDFPERGSPVATHTLKLNVPQTSYRLVYEVGGGRVEVLRVHHARQNWRPKHRERP